MTYIRYVVSKYPQVYKLLRSRGHEDEDIDQECNLEVLDNGKRYQPDRGMTRDTFDLSFSVRNALARLTQRTVAKCRNGEPPRQPKPSYDPCTYSDTVDALEPQYREVIEKHLGNLPLSRKERCLLRESERLLKEALGVT